MKNIENFEPPIPEEPASKISNEATMFKDYPELERYASEAHRLFWNGSRESSVSEYAGGEVRRIPEAVLSAMKKKIGEEDFRLVMSELLRRDVLRFLEMEEGFYISIPEKRNVFEKSFGPVKEADDVWDSILQNFIEEEEGGEEGVEGVKPEENFTLSPSEKRVYEILLSNTENSEVLSEGGVSWRLFSKGLKDILPDEKNPHQIVAGLVRKGLVKRGEGGTKKWLVRIREL